MLIQARTKPQSAYEEVKLLQTLNIVNTPEGLAFSLKAVCEFAGWHYGETWIPSVEGRVVELSPHWYIRNSVDSKTATNLEMFRLCSEGFVMAPNVGLPGRVWLSQQAEWIPNISAQSEAYFLRNKIARACGVKTALGIPMMDRGEVWAVLAFFKTV